MKIAICDDHKVICDEIRKKIAEYNPNYCIDLFHCGYELLNADKIYDIVFLDIEMNGINGMKTAELLRRKKNNEYIIFLTSHKEFMQEAFKVKAFRFLNKPFKQTELNEALSKVEKEIIANEQIVINEKNKVHVIMIRNVIYIESYGDGTYVYTQNEIIQSIKSLRYWMDILGNEQFFQIHKSYLISLKYVKKIDNSNVEMSFCKQLIPISRRKYPLFKKCFLDYVKKKADYL